MIQLRVLGVLDLRTRDGAVIRQVLAQPKRAALLSYLALARLGEARPRDTLLALLWPEYGPERARNALSQAVHFLRRALGGDVILSHAGDALSIDRSMLWCDADTFDNATRKLDHRAAIDTYRGDLLEGFHVADAPEFERWLDAERLRLGERLEAALETLALQRERDGDHPGARELWRRLAARAPYNSGVALRLARAMAASGDPADAARFARQHVRLLRDELDVAAPRDIEDFITELQARPRPPVAAPVARVVTAAAETHPESADELCARARQAMQTFTAESFADGIRMARRAVEIDPQHAGAHLTLGWLLILSTQVDGNAEVRRCGIEHCARAAALAPDLHAVYPALAWGAYLDVRLEEAERLALRGVDGDPADFLSHYVLGIMRLVIGLTRPQWDKCIEGMHSFLHALALHPRDTHALMVVGSAYTLSGQYEAARAVLEKAVELERAAATDLHSVGAQAFLGRLQAHCGQMSAARGTLQQARASSEAAPQLFAPFMTGVSGIALGDIARCEGRYDDAMQQYARARSVLATNPRLVGCGYMLVRVETRLASAFRFLRMRSEEQRHHAAAKALTASRSTASFDWTWGVSEANLHYDWAVYNGSRADVRATIDSLDRAVHFGWREASLLDTDPAFASLPSAATADVRARVLSFAPLPEGQISAR